MRAPRHSRGVAVVSAILVAAIAAAIAAQVAFAHTLWLRQAQNIAERDAAAWLRRGALYRAGEVLAADAAQGGIDYPGEAWAQPLPGFGADGGSARMAIEDAQARFNLNSVWRNGAASPADIAVLRRLLGSLGLDPSLADALVDWIDPDSDPRPGGAEDAFYLSGTRPYRAANQPLASVDELALVRGFGPKVLAALAPYVDALPQPTPINVNTAPPPVLAALIGGLDAEALERLVEARSASPFRDVAALAQHLPRGVPPPAAGAAVASRYFLVRVDASVGRLDEHSEALIERDGAKTTILWERRLPLAVADEQAR